MSHNHHHHHQSHGNIAIAFFLNLIFTLIEVIGGLLTNSLSILSDALHDLGDSISLGLAWYFEKISKKGSDAKFSYGYKRFSLLGAILNSVILIIGSIYILQSAIPRILSPEPTHAEGMLALAVLGVLINGIAAWKLREGHSINEKVVSLHLLEDVLGWLAVLVGSVAIYFTGWYVIDPVLSVMITGFILYNLYKNIKSTLKIILQGIPENIDVDNVKKEMLKISGVKSIHDLHIWSLDGNRNVLTVHIVLVKDDQVNLMKKIKNSVKNKMDQIGIDHCTIEFEGVDEECRLVNC